MAGLLPPIFVELKANASEFHAEMGKARTEIAHLETAGSASFQKLAAVGKVALMGLATTAITVGGEAIHMADKFELSHVRLENAIKNSGSTFDAWQSQIAGADKKLENLGFTNAESEQALGTLTAGLGGVGKALQVYGTAADLARFKNEDLNTASQAYIRALSGNARALKDLGITTAQYQAALKTTGGVQDLINAKIGGTAVAASETFSGKLETLRARTEDLGKNIGLWLVPWIEKLGNATASAAHWMEHHKTVAKDLGAVIGGALTLAVGAYIVKVGQSVVATTVGVGKQIGSWKVFGGAVTTTNETVVSTSKVAAAEVQAAWEQAALASGGAVSAFATEADAAFMSTVGPAGVAGAEAGAAFQAGLLRGVGKYGAFLMGGMSLADQGSAGPSIKVWKDLISRKTKIVNGQIVPGDTPTGTMSASSTGSMSLLPTTTLPSNFASLIYAATHKTPPAPTTYSGGGGGGAAAKAPTPLTPAQSALQDKLTKVAREVASQANLNPGSLAMAKVYEKAETATLKEAEAAKKHAAALVKAAHGAKAKEAATKVLAVAQADVNKATKNLLAIKKDEKTLVDAQKQAALDAAQAAAALANAKIEAGLDFSNAAAVAQAKVTEAQNTLNADAPDTLQWYLDKAALGQAIADLAGQTAQNTQATIQNTAAMVQPLNQLPTYLADRATVNAGAYAGSRGGSGAGASVTIHGGTFIGTNLDSAAQDIASALNKLSRRNGGTPLF